MPRAVTQDPPGTGPHAHHLAESEDPATFPLSALHATPLQQILPRLPCLSHGGGDARLHENELTVANATMMRPMINLPTVPSIRPTIAALLITRAIPGSVPFELSPR